MMIAANLVGGGIVNTPDQCIGTWVNVSFMFLSLAFSPNITMAGSPAIFMASVLAMSFGDEPDTPLYAPTKGPAFFPLGIPTVLLNGIPAISLLCPSISNAGNAFVGAVAVPSPNNVFTMYAEGDRPLPPALPAEALAEVRAALRDPSGPGRGAMLTDEIGHVAIDVFSPATPSMVHGAIRDLEARGMRLLILDLRGNPGGEVTAAVELAGDFLEPGTLVATIVDGDGDATDRFARAGTPHRVPLVLLVDRHTASAAELFAGSLRAHGRALVAGERTHGKGLIQEITPRPDGEGADCVSFATCLLPNGNPIHGVGVEPDIDLPF